MIIQAIKNTKKRHFQNAPLPLFAKYTIRNPENNPSITVLRNGDHKPLVRILPYNGPRIVTTEGQILSPRMERNPGGHINEILHHHT